MTKARPPVSFDNALARIAGLIGWAEMAHVTDEGERTVRRWGDPDTGRSPPIAKALLLDQAFMSAGGDGAPMYETYGLLVDAAFAERFADGIELGRRACTIIREGAQAEEALVIASQPGAGLKERRTARRELEELVQAATATIPLLADREAPP